MTTETSAAPAARPPALQSPATAEALMQRLHGQDIYAGFTDLLPADLQGWNSDHPAFTRLFDEKRPGIVIDLGVWKGASVAFMAKAQQRLGIDGMVIAIDTFLGSPEHWNRNREDRIHESLRLRHGYPGLYWQFLSNMVHMGVRDRVVPLPQTSENAAVILQKMRLRADLIHIDAAHEYLPVLRDARMYWDLLAPGGILVGDDFPWKGVAQAAEEFAAEVGQPLEVDTPKWIIRKPERRRASPPPISSPGT